MHNSKKNKIEAAIAEMISSGIVKPGQKIPSLRKASQLFNVSVTPVTEAYKELEQLGILQGMPKSGYVVVTDDLSALESLGGVQDFGNSMTVSREAIRPEPQVRCTYDFARPTIASGLFSGADAAYHISRSLKLFPNLVDIAPDDYEDRSLTEALSKFMLSYNLVCQSEEIVICSNDTPSTFTMALECCTQPGDAIILASPCAKIHIETAKARGLRILCVHSYPGVGIDPDELNRCLLANPGTKCLMLTACNQGPYGSRMPEETKERIASICRMNQLTIIEDDCFGHLNYDGKRPKPLKCYAPDNVIYLSSLTDALLPGIRLNWVCPGKHKTAFLRSRARVSAVPIALLQNGIASLINSRQFGKKLEALNQTLGDVLPGVMDTLYRCFPERTLIPMPKGGISIWLQLPNRMSASRLKERALSKGIRITTGNELSACGDFPDCICINFSTIAANPDMRRGLELLGEVACRLYESEIVGYP